MKDWQKKRASTPIKAFLTALLFIVLLTPVQAADSCTCTPELTQLSDDSASMRRELDLMLRAVTELQGRPWATPDQLDNVSANLTQMISDTSIEQQAKIDSAQAALKFEIQTQKMTNIVLVILAVACFFSLSSMLYGEKYGQIYRRLGVFPRRTPMTSRETDLEKRVKELESQVPAANEEPEKPTSKLRSTAKNVLVFLILLALSSAVVYIGGQLIGAW